MVFESPPRDTCVVSSVKGSIRVFPRATVSTVISSIITIRIPRSTTATVQVLVVPPLFSQCHRRTLRRLRSSTGQVEWAFQEHLSNLAGVHFRAEVERASTYGHITLMIVTHVYFKPVLVCLLPVPQPVDMQLPRMGFKLTVVTAALGFMARSIRAQRQDRTTRLKRLTAIAFTGYTALMIPATMISLVVYVAATVEPHMDGFYGKCTCFYAMWNAAPFELNYVICLVKFIGSRVLFGQSRMGIKAPSMDVLRRPLLEEGNTMAGELEMFKLWWSLLLPFVITILPYVVVEVPFILFFKIPALVICLPVSMVWISLMAVASEITAPGLPKTVTAIILDKTGIKGMSEHGRNSTWKSFEKIIEAPPPKTKKRAVALTSHDETESCFNTFTAEAFWLFNRSRAFRRAPVAWLIE